MIDLFPFLFATLKADTYFATTLAGFQDSAGNFKMFRRNEAPSNDTPFIQVEIEVGPQEQTNGWVTPFVTFTVHGENTDWTLLWTIAEKIRTILQAKDVTATISGSKVYFQTLGPALFDEGENPVTGLVNVSVALRLGFDAA